VLLVIASKSMRSSPVKVTVVPKIKIIIKQVTKAISKETKEVPKEETKELPKEETKEETKETIEDAKTDKLITVGTLIVCPRRLVGQWMQEIAKYTGYLTVMEISSMTHINKYTVSQIATADIVIVPSTMFSNANYIQNPKQLSHFQWTRLVVDEGHEFMACEGKKRIESTRVDSGIFEIPSKFRWACTGTPFPHGRSSLNGIISYLSGNDHNYISPYLSNISEHYTFLDLVCRRNTHTSTKDQITIPPYQEHIISVEFTKTERAIYDSASDSDARRKRQLCTNINVSDICNNNGILDLNQVNKVLAQQYQDDINVLKQDIIDTHIKIDGLKKHETNNLNDIIDRINILEALGDAGDELKQQRDARNKLQASIKGRIKNAEDRIINNDLKIIKAQEQMQIFRSLDQQSISKETCAILGTKLSDKFVITLDGQYYSYEGLNMLFIGRDIVTCPVTKKPIRKGSFLIVDPTVSGQEVHISVDRIKWGSKLAKVMEKLKEVLSDPDNRVIIFSQWNTILQLMSQYLLSNNISYVTAQGHTHQITCSINKFKTDNKTKVLLLSSESANSGSNITAANYIFLLDVVDGTPAEARAVESQAIGRAVRLGQTKVVQVYRFIVKDTIEELT
jgi:SNF2 family DNA or RNA helicase